MFGAVMVFARIVRALNVIGALIRDRKLVKELPWPYIRLSMRENRLMQVQLAGIVSMVVLIPVSAAMPESARGLPVALAVAAFIGAIGARVMLERRVKRLQ